MTPTEQAVKALEAFHGTRHAAINSEQCLCSQCAFITLRDEALAALRLRQFKLLTAAGERLKARMGS